MWRPIEPRPEGYGPVSSTAANATPARVMIGFVMGGFFVLSAAWASGLRFLRRFRLLGTVERDRLADERLEGGLVDVLAFVDVDRAAHVAVETGVEEAGRILQRRALGEGELHDVLVGF